MGPWYQGFSLGTLKMIGQINSKMFEIKDDVSI